MGLVINTPQGTVTGQTFNGSAPNVSINTDSIRFLPGASGTFVGCTFNGLVQFGTLTSDAAPLDGSGLRFEDCTVNGSWVGAVSDAYFDLHGTITAHQQVSGGISIQGSRNTFADTCDITVQRYSANDFAAFALKFCQNRGGLMVSSVGNTVGGTYAGAEEECVGWDAIYTSIFAGTVTGVDGDTVTVERLADSNWFSSTPAQVVGAHLSSCEDGAYYLIEAASGTGDEWDVTLDTATFAAPQIGDKVVLGPAMVECDWHPTVYAGGHVPVAIGGGEVTWRFGYGCNVGVSAWGTCHGNDFTGTTVICDGDSRLPATAFQDAAVIVEYDGYGYFNPKYQPNSHNIWTGCTAVDDRTDPTGKFVAFSSGTVCYSFGLEGITDPKDSWAGACNFGMTVTDCDFGGGLVVLNDATGVTWLGNTDTPDTTYSGLFTGVYVDGLLWWDDLVPSDWYSVWDGGIVDGQDTTQYALPKFEPSLVTFAADDLPVSPLTLPCVLLRDGIYASYLTLPCVLLAAVEAARRRMVMLDPFAPTRL